TLGRALGGVQAALVALGLVAVVGVLGWPADRVPALLLALGALVAAGVGWAIAHDLRRWTRAQEDGVFRVRSVL
ncbi:MAG TPA: hypothetical protein VJ814_00985, partial [Gaiellaceae bacterium]|nr:hypothetical protein [Gaiellaceae bacterium]